MAGATPALKQQRCVAAAAPGWSARLWLRLRGGPHHTQLTERERVGPLSVQRPFYPEGDVCHVYVLHPPGGAVGGDRLEVAVEATDAARALLTTPGAAKYYRSAGPRVSFTQRLSVAGDSFLEWLPQENIYFPGARVSSCSHIHLEGDARLVTWEIHCLGLPASGAEFDDGTLESRLEVQRDGAPLLLECLRVSPHTRRRLAGLRGLPVSATLLATGADPALCAELRKHVATDRADALGITCIEDLLIARYLGASTARAKALFTELWRRLRPAVCARDACAPRIWAT